MHTIVHWFIYTGCRCAVQHTIHSKVEDIDYRYLPQAYSQAYLQPGLSTARLIYSQAYLQPGLSTARHMAMFITVCTFLNFPYGRQAPISVKHNFC